jgi:hypothetical protein
MHAPAIDPGDRPWWEARRLWSLWDVIDIYAWYFFSLARLLERLHAEVGLPPPVTTPPAGLLTGLGGLGNALSPTGSAFQFSAPLPTIDELSDDQRKKITDILGLLKNICTRVDIGIAKDVDRAIRYIDLSYSKREKTSFYIETISDRIIDESREQKFLHVKMEKVPFYEDFKAVDGATGKKLSLTIEDIMSARSCYALGQHTACVFHLMRVMEHCVQRFGRKLKVKIDVKNETWHQIMLHVENGIDAMPYGKAASVRENRKREKYKMAANRLDHIRLVWRNKTTHPKDTYDEKQALEVLNSVKVFLESMVTII